MSHAPNVAPQAGLEISIAPVTDRDIGYCLGSWREAYKLVGDNRRMPWRVFKSAVTPELAHALTSSTLIGAYVAGEIVGWASITRSRRVPAIHWVHTRYRTDGVDWRRRGVAESLLTALELGPRIVYTHRGPKPRNPVEGDTRTSDVLLAAWLVKRGTYATFIPYKDWI